MVLKEEEYLDNETKECGVERSIGWLVFKRSKGAGGKEKVSERKVGMG